MANSESELLSIDAQPLAGDVDQKRTSFARRAAEVAERARRVAAKLAARASRTVQATQTGARATATALQRLPDSTLRWLAASSVGLTTGFYLAGRRRIVIAAGVAPAVVVGVALALRPPRSTVASEAGR
jgi:hypothetical protein